MSIPFVHFWSPRQLNIFKIELLNIFEICNSDHKQLMTTIDSLNSKYGKNTLNIASQKLDSAWAMRQNNLSSNYTTDFKDIITLNCNF